jgi:hypothetical protein
MRNKKSVLMTLNHNYGCFSGVGSGIAGNVPTLGEVADKLTFSFGKIPSTNIQNKHSIKHLNRNLAKRVLYDAFYFFNYFLKKFVYSKSSCIFVNEIKNQ